MDPMTLAAAVVAAVRPVLDRPDSPVAVYQMMRARLAEDTYHDTVLRGAQDQPDNDCRLQSLIGVLAEAATADPQFAAQLTRLLARTDPARYLQALALAGTRHLPS